MSLSKPIRCMTCLAVPYVLTKNVQQGQNISAEDFKGIHGYADPTNGEKIECPNCFDDKGLKEGMRQVTGLDVI